MATKDQVWDQRAEAERSRLLHDTAVEERLSGREEGAADMRERAAKLLNKEADLIGAVDGYDYKSGEEAGLRRGARLVGSLPLDPDSATGDEK